MQKREKYGTWDVMGKLQAENALRQEGRPLLQKLCHMAHAHMKSKSVLGEYGMPHVPTCPSTTSTVPPVPEMTSYLSLTVKQSFLSSMPAQKVAQYEVGEDELSQKQNNLSSMLKAERQEGGEEVGGERGWSPPAPKATVQTEPVTQP